MNNDCLGFCTDLESCNCRTYNSSSSTVSFLNIRNQVRRGSFFLYWDDALEIPPKLKTMQKYRLGLSQNDFSMLEYQLYCCRCINAKKNLLYTYAARYVQLSNDVYIKLIRYLSLEKVLHLCIWRWHNTSLLTMPSSDMICMFETRHTEKERDEKIVLKQTQIKINNRYTLRRVFWSQFQRQAAANTRDHYLYHFEKTYPMLWDCPWTRQNNDMIREFILALLKADVDLHIIHNICVEKLQSTEQTYLLKEKVPAAVQRTSITTFEPITDDIQAAIRLQRFYRKRLAIQKDAVRRIEVWWEPHRVENIEIRLEIAQQHDEVIERMEEELDLFQYKELVAEIKDDYKTVRRPETRTNKYWLKVIMILTVPVAIGILLESWNGWDNGPLMFVCYGAFQLLTIYRKLWKVLWFQTLVLWLFTVILLNREASMIQDGIRIPVWVFIVAVGRKRWILLFLVTLVIRIGLTFFSDTFSIQPTEYGLVVYDLYCMATIAGASRQGTPIEMLHKVVINVVFLIIIGFSGAVECLYGCLIINTD